MIIVNPLKKKRVHEHLSTYHKVSHIVLIWGKNDLNKFKIINTMDEELYDIIINDDNLMNKTNETKKYQTDEYGEDCKHDNYVLMDGFKICEECGIQLDADEFSQDAKWRYCGNTSVNASTNSQHNDKNIDDVFDKLSINISRAYKEETNNKFQETLERERLTDKSVSAKKNNASRGTVIRGNTRDSLVAGCLWHVYYEHDDPRTTSEISVMFRLNKTNVSAGKSRYEQVFPEHRNREITAKNLLNRMMQKAGIDPQYYKEISNIEESFRGTSKELLRSNSDSVAAAVLYKFLENNPDYQKGLGLCKKSFAEKVSLSDITITKLVKVINEVERRRKLAT